MLIQALAEIGLKYAQKHYLENKMETLKANIENEKYPLNEKKLKSDILISWYKISRRQFKSTDEIDQELKQYQSLVLSSTRDEAAIKKKQRQYKMRSSCKIKH